MLGYAQCGARVMGVSVNSCVHGAGCSQCCGTFLASCCDSSRGCWCLSLFPRPSRRGWLATGGRDKMVKVWDMNTTRAKEIYCVQTIASVARVKWRPECKHHIATCSMMVDHNIYVWDVRRPFIPSAMFEEHKDVTTGIVWRHLHDPYFLLSGSKDSTLYQHIFKDASQPIERANPEGLCYSLYGDLAFAAKESLISSDSNRKPYIGDRRHPIFFKRKLDPTEQFEYISSSSALSVFETDVESGSMDWFVHTAKQYALAGRPLAELCDHNAKVAKGLDRNQVSARRRRGAGGCCQEGAVPSLISHPSAPRLSLGGFPSPTALQQAQILRAQTESAQTQNLVCCLEQVRSDRGCPAGGSDVDNAPHHLLQPRHRVVR